MVDETIAGGRELDAFLQQLPVKVEKNIMRAALRAGANEFKKDVKERIASSGSVETGALYKSVRVTSRTKKGRVTASLKVGNKNAWYAHLIEFGVKAHGVKKGADRERGKLQDGKMHPGFAERPFMRPAADAGFGRSVEAVGKKIRERLTLAGINVEAPEGE